MMPRQHLSQSAIEEEGVLTVTNALAAWVRHDEGFAVVFLSWFGLLVWENELWTWAEVLWLIVVVVVDRWKSERVKDEGKEV